MADARAVVSERVQQEPLKKDEALASDQQPRNLLPSRESIGPSKPGTAHMAYGQGLEVEDWHADSPLNRVLASYESQFHRWKNVVESMWRDPDTIADVAAEDLELIRANMLTIVGTLGVSAAISLFSTTISPELAASTTIGAFVLRGLKKGVERLKVVADKARFPAMVANVGVHLEKWFWAAWTAKTPSDLKAAKRKFIDLLVVIAAPGQRAGAAWKTIPAPVGQTTLPALYQSGLPALRLVPAGGPTGISLLPHFASSNNDGLFTGGGGPSSDFGQAFELPSVARPDSVPEVSVNRSRVDQMIELVPSDMLTNLKRFGFDEDRFALFAERATKQVSTTVAGEITPLQPSDITVYPAPGTPRYAYLSKLGREARERGEVGKIILAGGMGTRFNRAGVPVVKSTVPVAEGKSFLLVKVTDVRTAGSNIPIYPMTSAFTHDRIVLQVEEEGLGPVEPFSQFVSLRFTPTGELFLDEGNPSLHATGHGDLTFALRASGVLERFRAGGGKYLFMSNVDNVAASLDDAVIGAHIESGAKMTAEVVRKQKGDAGGAPARVEGRPQIIEGFRFPKSFDQDTLPQFNTNTFVFNADAIDRDFPLTWYRVEKKVNGQKAIQFERLVGELPEFLEPGETHFLEVPRSRFLPVKEPEDLVSSQDAILSILRKIGL